MARAIERELYLSLINSNFSFMSRGRHHIQDIYDAVKNEYRNQCDDTYYCSENCSSGNDQPEWCHTVRNALQRLKSQTGYITFTGQRGYWEFS